MKEKDIIPYYPAISAIAGGTLMFFLTKNAVSKEKRIIGVMAAAILFSPFGYMAGKIRLLKINEDKFIKE